MCFCDSPKVGQKIHISNYSQNTFQNRDNGYCTSKDHLILRYSQPSGSISYKSIACLIPITSPRGKLVRLMPMVFILLLVVYSCLAYGSIDGPSAGMEDDRGC